MKCCYYVIGFLLLALIYFILGTIDCEEPSLARFALPDPAPASEDDNVYFGIVAATNALPRKYVHAPLFGLSEEEEDAILSTNAEAVAAALQASHRSVWRGPREAGSDGLAPIGFSEIMKVTTLCFIQGEVGGLSKRR